MSRNNGGGPAQDWAEWTCVEEQVDAERTESYHDLWTRLGYPYWLGFSYRPLTGTMTACVDTRKPCSGRGRDYLVLEYPPMAVLRMPGESGNQWFLVGPEDVRDVLGLDRYAQSVCPDDIPADGRMYVPTRSALERPQDFAVLLLPKNLVGMYLVVI